MRALRRIAGTFGGTALITLLVGSGMPGISALVFLVTSVLATTCWILGSPDRSERICRMLLAGRGDPRCLSTGSSTPPSQPPHPGVSLAAPPTEQSRRLLPGNSAVTHRIPGDRGGPESPRSVRNNGFDSSGASDAAVREHYRMQMLSNMYIRLWRCIMVSVSKAGRPGAGNTESGPRHLPISTWRHRGHNHSSFHP
jgi:hypothetical protein